MARPIHIVYPDADEGAKTMFAGERIARLERLGTFAMHVGARPETGEYLRRIEGAQGILLGWDLPNEVMCAAPGLEVVSFTGYGVANFVDLAEATRLGITVTRTPSAADTVAEHTMALMLAAARHIAGQDRAMRAGTWNAGLQGFDLRGKTLGLIGFGRIAEAVVPLARAFGMRIIAWTKRPSAERAARHGVAFADLDTVLGGSDVLSLHLALTPETEGLIGASELAKTRPGVVLINTARAQIVDETALIELLGSGHIAAAGLDVFHVEPLPEGHPFRAMGNVVLTPHTGFNTPEAVAAIADMAIANLEAYFAGAPTNVATPQRS